jgi:hypothetical protein
LSVRWIRLECRDSVKAHALHSAVPCEPRPPRFKLPALASSGSAWALNPGQRESLDPQSWAAECLASVLQKA